MTRSDFLAFALSTMQALQDDIPLVDRTRLRWLFDFQVDALLREEPPGLSSFLSVVEAANPEKGRLAHGVWMSERVGAYRDVKSWLKDITRPQTHGFTLYNHTHGSTWQRVGGFSSELLNQEHRLLDSAAFIQGGLRGSAFRLRVFDVAHTGEHTQRDVHFQLIGVRRINTARAGIEEDTYRIHSKPHTRVALTANLWHWKAALNLQAESEDPGKRWTKLLRKLEEHEVFTSHHAMQDRGNYLLAQREHIWLTWECDTTYEEAADKLVLLTETLRNAA